MDKRIIQEKINQAIEILNEKKIDLWLIFARESATIHDPSIDIVVGTNCTWQSAFMINRNGDTTAILGSLDVPNMEMTGTFKNVTGYVKSIKEPFLEYLNKHKPVKIAVNYSVDSNLADGLTHGMFLVLNNLLKETPFKDSLVSSEEVIAALRGRKSKTELDYMKEAVKETLLIFDMVTNFMKPGKTEKEVGAFIKRIVAEKGFELAWDEDHCPAVFTGPDTAGAHAGPTDRVIEKGHIINIDFGVKINGYCSDLQRTWYVFEDGQDTAPEEVQKGFDVLKESIRKAKAIVKPGITGCEVDDTARNYIVENGYEEYQHALGHQVGRVAHDGGVGFYPRWERYGKLPYLPIEVGQVFTIEPRLTVKDRGIVTMEEEIVVTENGCEYLSTPQEELILIK